VKPEDSLWLVEAALVCWLARLALDRRPADAKRFLRQAVHPAWWTGIWVLALPCNAVETFRASLRDAGARGGPPSDLARAVLSVAGVDLVYHITGPLVGSEQQAQNWIDTVSTQLARRPSPEGASVGERRMLALTYFSEREPSTGHAVRHFEACLQWAQGATVVATARYSPERTIWTYARRAAGYAAAAASVAAVVCGSVLYFDPSFWAKASPSDVKPTAASTGRSDGQPAASVQTPAAPSLQQAAGAPATQAGENALNPACAGVSAPPPVSATAEHAPGTDHARNAPAAATTGHRLNDAGAKTK
jgi:hypothetical protein